MAISTGRISKNNIVQIAFRGNQDIKGSNIATVSGDEGWVSFGQGQEIMALLQVIVFDALDTLNTLQLEEAKNAFGLDSALITVASGPKSLTLLPADVTAGKVFTLEAKASDLSDGFGFIRLAVAETTNTSEDTVCVAYVLTKGSGDITSADAKV